MNIEKIDTYLKAHTEINMKAFPAYENETFYKDVKTDENGIYIFQIPKAEHILVSKNERFKTVPLHKHDFIEIMFMYSGTCEQTIGNKQFTLRKGQLVFIDTNTPHKIGYTDEDDILINILVSQDFISQIILENMDSPNLISSFFINALNSENKNLNYLIYNIENNGQIKLFLYELIWESFHPKNHTNRIKECLFTLVLLEMMASDSSLLDYQSLEKTNHIVLQALQYMTTNFLTCDLSSTASHVGLNPCYLTTLLKKEIGKSYKEIILHLKMELAKRLLLTHEHAIDDIAALCGYENLTFFYKKFKELSGMTPKEFQKSKNIYE